ncbi:Putative cation transporter [Candidatus Fokinia solitaria]|uniref:Cation transporter n=1 Tax=Candidatus Fokinia solitaria TaxID=1802984 RepID=A0A2U8BRQ5_9RICK|nr:cation:proton antiporter [Candidatus Fokinia solitaria]AWD32950.1 Putative cation transporter [Candidatus Fokinia solitaria]
MFDVLILLSVSIFIVVLSHKIKLSPVLGYLTIGAVLGKHGFNIVQDHSVIEMLAELGVTLLLFVIGLELTFERLIKMRWYVIGMGGGQVILTSVLLSIIIMKLSSLEHHVCILIGTSLSLSSTAIVMPVLEENKRTSTRVGRAALAILLLQDIIVVLLFSVTELLSTKESTDTILSAMGIAALKAMVGIIGITIAGRIFLRPFLSLIGSVKKEEIYVATAVFLVLGASHVMKKFGVSEAMGALLAGILIAETEYRQKIEESIMPFYGLLLGLFFFTVGMSLDLDEVAQNYEKIFCGAVILLVCKGLIIGILCRLWKMSWGAAAHAGLVLGQGGEFTFVLFSLASGKGLIEPEMTRLLYMIITISMAFTPLLAFIGMKIEDLVESKNLSLASKERSEISDLEQHVIIAGFGRVGRTVAYMLEQEQIPYVALDSNVMLVKTARREGFPVFYADFLKKESLDTVRTDKAQAVVLCMSDKGILAKAVRMFGEYFSDVPLIAKVEDYRHSRGIKKLGASQTVPTTIETGLQLGGCVLMRLEIPESEVIKLKQKIRKNDYLLIEEIELFKGVSHD